ncbi:MAG: hypothetical protein ACJ76T_06960, partial [Solirubrobacteraceae bacterium]
VRSVTAGAALMVGVAGMAPEPVELSDRISDRKRAEELEKETMERYVRIGRRIMNTGMGGGGMMGGEDPLSAILRNPDKNRAVAGMLGQAFVAAYVLVQRNQTAVEKIAETLMERGEMYGNEVVDLLDHVGLVKPEIDVLNEQTWPKV